MWLATVFLACYTGCSWLYGRHYMQTRSIKAVVVNSSSMGKADNAHSTAKV